MPPPRLILAIGTGTALLAGLAAALQSWPIDGTRARAFVRDRLAVYGLGLADDGPVSVTLLPLPSLRFDDTRIRIGGPDGPILADGGRLTVKLSPASLLSGQAELGSLILDRARIDGAALSAPGTFAEPLARLTERIGREPGAHPHRLRLTRATLDGGGPARTAHDVDLDLTWPAWSAALEGTGSATWKGGRANITIAGLRPADLAAGATTPISAVVAWPDGNLRAEGVLGLAERVTLAGTGRLETRSLASSLAWIGRDAALAPLAGAFTLEGRFESQGGAVTVPRLRVTLGTNVLDGAASVDLAAPRALVQATLAAETLDFAPLLSSLAGLFGPTIPETEPSLARAASPAIALAPLTGGDLDLRLSASAGRIGLVPFSDMAASVLVRGEAIEIALNRATAQGGTIKGRIGLAASARDPAETEMRAQAAFERLDLGGVLADLGLARWLTGPAQGHLALESSGRDVESLTAHVAGRAGLAMQGGAIAGLDLADVIQRNGQVAPGALARRNARTAFEAAAVSMRFSDGVGEIEESGLRGGNVTASLRGQMSLPLRRIAARAGLTHREPARTALFEITGPWHGPSVRTAPQGSLMPDAPPGGDTTGPDSLRPPAAFGLPRAARAFAPQN